MRVKTVIGLLAPILALLTLHPAVASPAANR